MTRVSTLISFPLLLTYIWSNKIGRTCWCWSINNLTVGRTKQNSEACADTRDREEEEKEKEERRGYETRREERRWTRGEKTRGKETRGEEKKGYKRELLTEMLTSSFSNDCSVPICSSPCVKGNCTAPDTCACDSGWSGADCSTPVCSPSCGANGFCDGRLSPPTCVCNATWTNAPACDTKATTCPTSAVNGQICGGVAQGTCDAVSLLCQCVGEWSGVSCDVAMCNGVDTNVCSGRGVCDATVSPHK